MSGLSAERKAQAAAFADLLNEMDDDTPDPNEAATSATLDAQAASRIQARKAMARATRDSTLRTLQSDPNEKYRDAEIKVLNELYSKAESSIGGEGEEEAVDALNTFSNMTQLNDFARLSRTCSDE